jgi:hypothetical protein
MLNRAARERRFLQVAPAAVPTALPALPAGSGAPIMAPVFEEEGTWSE